MKKQLFSGHALHTRKDVARRKDAVDLKSGIPGEAIARRNGCVSEESVRKARIVFA